MFASLKWWGHAQCHVYLATNAVKPVSDPMVGDHLWLGGPTVLMQSVKDGPHGPSVAAVLGPGGPSMAATLGPEGPIVGGPPVVWQIPWLLRWITDNNNTWMFSKL